MASPGGCTMRLNMWLYLVASPLGFALWDIVIILQFFNDVTVLTVTAIQTMGLHL